MSKEPARQELEDLIKANAFDREYLIGDFMGNVISPAIVPEFDTAMVEFLRRTDDDLFELITSEINPVVFNSFGASTSDSLTVICSEGMSSRPPKEIGGGVRAHEIPFILIGGGFIKRTPLGRVGEIAHEFAHCVLAHQKAESHKHGGGPDAEAEADALAKSWG